MKKGKTQALVVLAVEIASIAVLHAVKLSQSEKHVANNSSKEISRSAPSLQQETKMHSSYSLAVFH